MNYSPENFPNCVLLKDEKAFQKFALLHFVVDGHFVLTQLCNNFFNKNYLLGGSLVLVVTFITNFLYKLFIQKLVKVFAVMVPCHEVYELLSLGLTMFPLPFWTGSVCPRLITWIVKSFGPSFPGNLMLRFFCNFLYRLYLTILSQHDYLLTFTEACFTSWAWFLKNALLHLLSLRTNISKQRNTSI